MPVLHWGRCLGKWPTGGSLLAPLLCVLGVHKLPHQAIHSHASERSGFTGEGGPPVRKWGCCPWDLLFRVWTPGGAPSFVVFIQSLSPLSMGCSVASFPCPSLSPEVCSNSGPLSQWCNPAISSSVIPLSSCLQSFPASGSFPVSWLFASGGQSIGASVLAISPLNEYSGLISFRIDCFDLLAVQGTLKSLLQHHSSKASVLRHSAFFMIQLSHPYRTIGKTIALTIWTFVGKVMSILLNTLSRFIIAFHWWPKPSPKELVTRI